MPCFHLGTVFALSLLLSLALSDDCVQVQSYAYEGSTYFQKLVCTLNPDCSSYDTTTITPDLIEFYEKERLLVTASRGSIYRLTKVGLVVVQEVFDNTQWNSKLSFAIAVPKEGQNVATYRCTVKGKKQSGEPWTLTNTYSSASKPVDVPISSPDVVTDKPPNEPETATDKSDTPTKEPLRPVNNDNWQPQPETRPCLRLKAGLTTAVSSAQTPSDHFSFDCIVSKCNDADQWTLNSIRIVKVSGVLEVGLAIIQRPQGAAVPLMGKPPAQNFKVSGLLSEESSSFLRAEWDRSDASDYGVYRCTVTFSNMQSMSRNVSENTEFQSTGNFVNSLLNSMG